MVTVDSFRIRYSFVLLAIRITKISGCDKKSLQFSLVIITATRQQKNTDVHPKRNFEIIADFYQIICPHNYGYKRLGKKKKIFINWL